MKVELLDHMGSDLSVVRAARVSFQKETYWDVKGWDDDNNPIVELSDRDKKLIGYLAKHNHWTPFGHCFASFRIKAPLFVARQLGKHQVGLCWNEESRRYIDSEPEFYVPEKGQWRLRAENVKQGSSTETFVGTPHNLTYGAQTPASVMGSAVRLYKSMIEQGICPEQARIVLPQSLLVTFIWSGSLAAFARVCKLRLDPHTQKETRDIAEMISNEMAQRFPVSWQALMEN